MYRGRYFWSYLAHYPQWGRLHIPGSYPIRCRCEQCVVEPEILGWSRSREKYVWLQPLTALRQAVAPGSGKFTRNEVRRPGPKCQWAYAGAGAEQIWHRLHINGCEFEADENVIGDDGWKTLPALFPLFSTLFCFLQWIKISRPRCAPAGSQNNYFEKTWLFSSNLERLPALFRAWKWIASLGCRRGWVFFVCACLKRERRRKEGEPDMDQLSRHTRVHKSPIHTLPWWNCAHDVCMTRFVYLYMRGP